MSLRQNSRIKPLPDLAELKTNFRYCAETGRLFHAVDKSSNAKAGYCAESFSANGKYKRVIYKRRQLLAHRVAWAMSTGVDTDKEIDHINGDGTDNRLSNLRAVSPQENQRNQCARRARKVVGCVGVRWRSDSKCWESRISTSNGVKSLHRGTLLDCVAARKSAEQRLGYL